MELVPLHHCKEFTESCTEILNSFWPRSLAAREHSLNQSCDSMPVSLVLINRQHNKDAEVIGYSRITAVQGILQACLVESVIIREVDRGKGLGRVLMQLTEDFARNKLNMKVIYLNTIDQQAFYSRLGYSRCNPVISLGANAHRIPEHMLQRLLGSQGNQQLSCLDQLHTSKSPSVCKEGVPPPPPPPQQHISYNHAVVRMDPNSVFWMKKDL